MTGAEALRVGVNLTWLVPGVVGGSEEYLVRSLLALPAGSAPRRPTVTVFGLAALAEAYPELGERFDLVTVPLPRRLKAARVGAESSWLAVETRRRALDVVHHGGGVLPLWAPARTVVTIHDLQPLEHPAAFSRAKREWLGRMVPRSVRRADLVVTTSEFVRRGVLERFGAAPERVRLVPPCPPLPSSAPPPPGGLDEVRRRFGIGDRYVLYAAITYPHKNHAVLVEALATGAWPADLHLVLAGGSGPAEADLTARTEQLAPERRRLVHRVGRIPRGDLDALLGGARALAFPSTYEGFGMPVLEALAAGTPVVASRAGALPEVVGGAGPLLDPHDAFAWATALAHVAGASEAERSRLAAGARARATRYTAARTGAALLDAWRRAAASTAGPRDHRDDRDHRDHRDHHDQHDHRDQRGQG